MTSDGSSLRARGASDPTLDYAARLWLGTAVTAWLLWLVPWAAVVLGGLR